MNRLREKAKDLKAELSLSHPLVIMMAEHDEILKFLDNLEQLNSDFQQWEDIQTHAQELAELKSVAENLLAAENHHRREEDALFPRLEQVGISGPPMVMRMEHDELRVRKKQLLELVQQAKTMEGAAFRSRLNDLTETITETLRRHIDKENNILYPAALENIPDADQWSEIKKESDRIGYCPFTPEP